MAFLIFSHQALLWNYTVQCTVHLQFSLISNDIKVREVGFLSDEGPMLETLDYTIRIGRTPT